MANGMILGFIVACCCSSSVGFLTPLHPSHLSPSKNTASVCPGPPTSRNKERTCGPDRASNATMLATNTGLIVLQHLGECLDLNTLAFVTD